MDPDPESDSDPDADPAIFICDLQNVNKKKVFCLLLLEVHLLYKIKSHKEVTKQKESIFLLDDRRIRIRISVSLTNGSGSATLFLGNFCKPLFYRFDSSLEVQYYISKNQGCGSASLECRSGSSYSLKCGSGYSFSLQCGSESCSSSK
jgi:hypothetical protein